MLGYHTEYSNSYLRWCNLITVVVKIQIFHRNLFFVLDVDECTKGTHSCDVNAVCANTLGSYNCTCKDGFYGDGINCTGNYLFGLIFSRLV